MKVGTKTKKLTVWSCLSALLLSLFASACGGPGETGGPVTLSLWMYPSAGEVGGPPDNWFLTRIVREELNIDLQLTLIPYGDEGDTKYNAAAAADDMPDLFQIPFNNNIFLTWVRNGLISPVESLFPLMPERTRDRYSDEQMKQVATINGQQFVLQEKTNFNKRRSLFIRQDWLDNLNLEAPTNLDEFLAVARAFTKDDPDQDGQNDTYGYAAPPSTIAPELGDFYQAFFGAYGIPSVWNFKEPGKVSLSLRDPGYFEVMKFLREMSDDNLLDPDWPTMINEDVRTGWKQQGEYGIISEDFCAAICIGNYEAFDTNFPEGEWVPLAPPQGPDGTSLAGDSSNIGTRIAVSQKAMDAGKGEAIAKLLNWLNSGEGYNLAAFGEEGQNYTLDEQGQVTKEGAPVPYDSPEGLTLNQMRSIVYTHSQEELQARYQSFETKNGRTIDPVEVYNTIAGFNWEDQTAVTVIQPATNQTDINRYVNENVVQFLTGQKDLDQASWNAFIQGLDNLNVPAWEEQANQNLQESGLL